MTKNLFVNIMMILQVGAVFSNLFYKDWGMAVYWLGCLMINFVVTYII